MQPTNAFDRYVDSIFIITNYLQNYVIKNKDYFNVPEMKLDDYDAEERVRFGICRKVIKEIEYLTTFNSQKQIYIQSINKLTGQDLYSTEFFKKKQLLDDMLFSLAKFEYVKNKYKNENYIRNDLQNLGYLATILIKLQVKQNKINPNSVKHSFSRTNLYKYIKEASLEELNIDIGNYKRYSIQELIEKLYDITVNFDYEQENTIDEPNLAINIDENKNINYVQDLLNIHVIDEDNSFDTYKNKTDKEVQSWLIDEMHRLDNGKTF